MKKNTPMQVKDILTRKHFGTAKVIAGQKGLSRIIKWVHVVEVIQIQNLLNGNELILSTGMALKNDKTFLSVLQQFITSKTAGLCIEIGTFMKVIPKEVLALANENDFPIIIFEEEVPFVEITQDIHSELINNQYEQLSNLERYSQHLNKKLLEIQSVNDILQVLYKELECQIIYREEKDDEIYYPPLSSLRRENLERKIDLVDDQTHHAVIPIYLLGQKHATLTIYKESFPLSEFDHLILDRTSTALAQHLLRTIFNEEKRRTEETNWINNWLEGEFSYEQLRAYLDQHELELNGKGAVVCSAQYEKKKNHQIVDVTYVQLLFRTIFEQEGFTILISERRNQFVFILLDKRQIATWKQRVKEALNRIYESDLVKKNLISLTHFGVGKYVDDLEDILLSYESSTETIRVYQNSEYSNRYSFYEDLHLHRILSLLHHEKDMKELILEYLTPVIEYDEKYNGKLFKTLQTYLACHGSKQETAKKLFIVRQTLYHRLEKLEKLLGKDFMNPEKRVAIEFMLHSFEYLFPKEKRKQVNVK
ncbi:PucR family transcriptional regulator [Rossellomorea sp. BNER]|uniref:PucR family transcriptional regulator n=1 Tax=Rossellomorea sp. BNER TaxID=2962031 RepID=UPI003AF2FA91|nr:PucR family transcriptional regulator ligand-binding domain-containing protein [Rossellomorea sp. BNER]